MDRDLKYSIPYPEFENLNYAIDDITSHDDYIEVSGWVVQKDSLKPPKVSLKEQKRLLSLRLNHRPDVTKALDLDMEDDLIGFNIRYNSSKTPKATIIFTDDQGIEHELKLNFSSALKENLRKVKELYSDYGIKGTIDFFRKNKQRVWIDYDNWYFKEQNKDYEENKDNWESLKYKPKISIVMPVYNIDPKLLKKAINSVRDQTYPNWELCIADDCSTDPRIRKLLNRFETWDNRIKVIFRTENGHIAEATNSALTLATGEYIGFMDDDDTLSKNTLYEYVKLLNEDPNIDVIYCDEDKINLEEFHFNPFFKSNWNERLLLSHNFITHFVLVKKSLVEEVGGLRTKTNGAQDYDFLLRILNKTKNFVHVPKVLYNWRVVQSSVAENPEVKNYAFPAGQKAIQDYLDHNNIDAHAEIGQYAGVYKIERNEHPKVSIIIPFMEDENNRSYTTLKAVSDLTDYPDYEIIAVNFDKDIMAHFYSDFEFKPNIKFINSVPGNSFELLKNGAAQAKSEYLAVVKPGIIPHNRDWLKRLMDETVFPETGLVTPMYIEDDKAMSVGYYYDYDDNKIIYPANETSLENVGYFYRSFLPQNVEGNFSQCFVIKKEDFDLIDDLDFKIEPLTGLELANKIINLGKKNVITPYSKVTWAVDKEKINDNNEEAIALYEKIHPADNYDFLKKYSQPLEQYTTYIDKGKLVNF